MLYCCSSRCPSILFLLHIFSHSRPTCSILLLRTTPCLSIYLNRFYIHSQFTLTSLSADDTILPYHFCHITKTCHIIISDFLLLMYLGTITPHNHVQRWPPHVDTAWSNHHHVTEQHHILDCLFIRPFILCGLIMVKLSRLPRHLDRY